MIIWCVGGVLVALVIYWALRFAAGFFEGGKSALVGQYWKQNGKWTWRKPPEK